MSQKILFSIILVILVLTVYPVSIVSAQLFSYGPDLSIQNLMHSIENATGLIFGGIAVVCFVIAGILFLTAQGDAEKLKIARSAFIWGVAGVVVGLIAFSIIAIVSSQIH